MRISLCGIQLRRFAQFSDTFRKFIFQLQRQAQIVVQRRVIGRILQRNLKFSDGGIEIRLLQIRRSQVRAITGISGSQSQGGFELLDRAIAIANLKRASPRLLCPSGFSGCSRTACRKASTAPSAFPECCSNKPSSFCASGKSGLQFHGVLHFAYGLMRFSSLLQSFTQEVVRLRILRIQCVPRCEAPIRLRLWLFPPVSERQDADARREIAARAERLPQIACRLPGIWIAAPATSRIHRANQRGMASSSAATRISRHRLLLIARKCQRTSQRAVRFRIPRRVSNGLARLLTAPS